LAGQGGARGRIRCPSCPSEWKCTTFAPHFSGFFGRGAADSFFLRVRVNGPAQDIHRCLNCSGSRPVVLKGQEVSLWRLFGFQRGAGGLAGPVLRISASGRSMQPYEVLVNLPRLD
jgi:hypothetical protein